MCSEVKLRVEGVEDGVAKGSCLGSAHLSAPHRLCQLRRMAELFWVSGYPSVKWGQDRWPRTWHTVSALTGGDYYYCCGDPLCLFRLRSVQVSREPRWVIWRLGHSWAGVRATPPSSPDCVPPLDGPRAPWSGAVPPMVRWAVSPLGGAVHPLLLGQSPSSPLCPPPGLVHSASMLAVVLI